MAHVQYLLLVVIMSWVGISNGNCQENRQNNNNSLPGPVLDAFRNCTVGFEAAARNAQTAVNSTFASFEVTYLKTDPVRAKPAWEKAIKVKEYTNVLSEYINETKSLLIQKAGGIDENNGDIKARDNTDITQQLMINNGRAQELKSRIDDTRKKIIGVLSPKDQEGLQLSLAAQDPREYKGVKRTWEEENFGNGIPVATAITTLTKIQSDLVNSEADVVKKILGETDNATIIKYNYGAMVAPNSTYLFPGEEYRAEVFLHERTPKNIPNELIVNGRKVDIAQGQGAYTIVDPVPGDKTWSGVMRFKDQNGYIKEYPIPEQHYTVARPFASAFLNKMSVLYIGVDNPVTIASPNFKKDKLSATITNGEIKEGNGCIYNISVRQPGTVRLNVYGEKENEKKILLDVFEFRAKRIPDPAVTFGPKGGGSIRLAEMGAYNRVFAVLDQFDFNAAFIISHFTLRINLPGKQEPVLLESANQLLTPEMVTEMNQLTAGAIVSFTEVKATGPDGLLRKLTPIVFFVER